MDYFILHKLFIIVLLLLINSMFSSFWFLQRKQTMMIDAISHSILPILVLAFLISKSLNSVLFTFFSVVASTLVAFFISRLANFRPKFSQSIIGIFFSGFFALGILMINYFAQNVHLDTDSVLFGMLEFSVFETVSLFGFLVPVAILKLLILLCFNLLFFKFFNSLFTLLNFDSNLLKVKGFNVDFVDLIQWFVLVLNIIFAFEIVGVIMTLGINVIPILLARYFNFKADTIFQFYTIFVMISLMFASFIAFNFNLSLSAVFVVLSGIVTFSSIFLHRYYLNRV